jgi:hypothetical protein
VTHPSSDDISCAPDGSHDPAAGGDEGSADTVDATGPDPVIGAGLALFGIFVMAIGGARDLHYVFDVGVAIAIIGAVVFVLFVALSAMQQRRLGTPRS